MTAGDLGYTRTFSVLHSTFRHLSCDFGKRNTDMWEEYPLLRDRAYHFDLVIKRVIKRVEGEGEVEWTYLPPLLCERER